MTLLEVLRNYILEHSLTPESEKQLAIPCKLFVQWLGFDPEVRTLKVETINEFLRFRQQTVSRTTAGNNANAFRRLLRYAHRRGWCRKPEGIRRIRPAPTIPRAWDLDQLRRLLAACQELSGELPNGVPRRLYFSCMLLVAWDTGMRPCDLKTLRTDEVDRQGRVYRAQRKTGWGVVGQLAPATHVLWNRVAALVAPDPCPLRWPLGKTRWFQLWAQIREQAGLDGRGVLKQVRKSAASYVEKHFPGSAQKFLGHRTPGLAYRHYVDPRIAYEQPVRPPSLLDGDAA